MLSDDICKRKSRDNAHSRAAHEVVRPTKEIMLNRIVKYGLQAGTFTLKEVCRAFGKEKNEISPRLSDGKRDGFFEETGETRERCAVLRVKRFA